MTNRAKFLATAAALVAAAGFVTPASAQSVQQEIINSVIQNILQNVRDQIQHRRIVPAPGMMRFSSEDGVFDNRDPFASKGETNPFAALAYAKAPAMAAPAPAQWIYGINVIGSVDRSDTITTNTMTYTGTGAFDATKIGIFTATDALSFVVTGSGSWANQRGALPWLDITTTTGSGTLAYVNGGFSTDFTAAGSWTRNSLVSVGIIAAPADSSSLSYTGNAQYKYDLLSNAWIEPTAGVTYTEIYTQNFGTKIGDSTEVHAGARVGTEMKWMTYTVQPSASAVVFKVVDTNGITTPNGVAAVAGADTGLGFRGNAKINVIWTPSFSSYVDVHGSDVSGTKSMGFIGTRSIGGQAGLRYTW